MGIFFSHSIDIDDGYIMRHLEQFLIRAGLPEALADISQSAEQLSVSAAYMVHTLRVLELAAYFIAASVAIRLLVFLYDRWKTGPPRDAAVYNIFILGRDRPGGIQQSLRDALNQVDQGHTMALPAPAADDLDALLRALQAARESPQLTAQAAQRASTDNTKN
ncbi:hypothetical protein EWM64_g9819 [Hericium alpestre]|uniref:Uncharacterized protein n=1 Tax=Hericium alpestre TaxID=135208 RepID=A0A4Y9ZIC2_9AGAM|nr:hypothetical protein EWM64_g9819 [Hericium alpestre]